MLSCVERLLRCIDDHCLAGTWPLQPTEGAGVLCVWRHMLALHIIGLVITPYIIDSLILTLKSTLWCRRLYTEVLVIYWLWCREIKRQLVHWKTARWTSIDMMMESEHRQKSAAAATKFRWINLSTETSLNIDNNNKNLWLLVELIIFMRTRHDRIKLTCNNGQCSELLSKVLITSETSPLLSFALCYC